MGRVGVLIFSVIFSSGLFSQDKLLYKAKGFYCNHYDSKFNDSIIATQAVGKDVKITSDLFFKSIVINFMDENDQQGNITLKYLSSNGGGIDKMVDDSGIIWYVANDLEKNKQLTLTPDIESKNGVWKGYNITKAERIINTKSK